MNEEQKPILRLAQDQNPNHEDGKKHFPEDSHAPKEEKSSESGIRSQESTSNQQPSISTAEVNKPEISTMEVHKHPHHVTHKKKWGEYSLEFLMLFLAVFLGFLAENIRENISENSKARELAESLYQEVYADSVTMHSRITMRLQKEDQMQYFREYVSDSNLTHLSERFYPSFAWTVVLTTSVIFEPNDGILNQLRNSGTLRYFKSPHLQDCVSRMNVAISNARERNGQEYRFIEQFVRPFTLKHYDFKWMDDYTQNGKLSILEALGQTNYRLTVKPVIKNLPAFNRQDAEGLAAYYLLILRATRQLHYQAYIERNHDLLEALRAEYGFTH